MKPAWHAAPPRPADWGSRILCTVLLFGILWVGFSVRHAGWNWGNPVRDQPGQWYGPISQYHPDERGIVSLKAPGLVFEEPPGGRGAEEGWLAWQVRRLQYNARVDSRWNVGSFNYGEMPYHLLWGTAQWLNAGRAERLAAGADPDGFWGVEWTPDRWPALGRGISALAGTLSILLLYLVGARAYGRSTGLIAALFLTFCVLHVQLCHYYAFEPLLVLFILLALYACVGVAQTGRLHFYLLAALGIGLAVATKFSGVTLPAALVVAHLLYVAQRQRAPLAWEQVRAGKAPLRWAFPAMIALQVLLGLYLLVWTLRFLHWVDHPEAVPADYANALCDLERYPFRFWTVVWALLYLLLAWAVVQARKVLQWRRRRRGVPVVHRADEPLFPAGHWFFRSTLPWLWLVLAVYVGIGTAWVFQPHAFTESYAYSAQEAAEIARARGPEIGPPGKFWQTVLEQKRMVEGEADFAYVRQYHGTTNFFYEVRTFVWESLGLPLGLVMLAGLAVIVIGTALRPYGPSLVLAAWAVPVFVVQATFAVKFPRYHIAEIPVFLLFGAWLLDYGMRIRIARPGSLLRHVPWRWLRRLQVASALVFAVTLLYSAAYTRGLVRAFQEPHPWEQATRWMYRNIPEGSRLVFTHWEDELPVGGVVDVPAREFRTAANLPLYEPDDENKVRAISRILEQSDYLILPSKRLYGGTMNDPVRYPLTSNFWRVLFSGDLGFSLVHTEANPIQVLWFEKDDDEADESFRVYERPKVHIFERVTRHDAERMASLIADPPEFARGITFKQVLHARADRSIWEVPLPRFPVVRWLAVLALVTVSAFPLLFVALRATRLRGLAVAPPLGITLIGLVPWFLAGVGALPFGRLSVYLTLAVFAALATWWYACHGPAVRRFLRRQWRDVAACLLVFLVFFGFFLAIRVNNPAIYWGEKPMEFSFLNAVERTETFPPADPWIAGRNVNYYYYGYVLLGTLGKIAGLPPRFVFNLAVVTVPALVALAAFGIVVDLSRRYRYGVLAAFLVCCAGSLLSYELFTCNILNWVKYRPVQEGLFQQTHQQLTAALPGLYDGGKAWLAGHGLLSGIWECVWTFVAYVVHLPRALALYASIVAGKLDRETLNIVGFDSYLWKCAHGVIPGTAANEYPAWTFLFCDLHPHMIVMPFSLLFAALALALLPREGAAAPKYTGRRALLLYALLGIVVGAITCINTWDMPTCLLLLGTVLLLRWYRPNSLPISAVLWPLRRLRGTRGERQPAERLWIGLYALWREVAFPLLVVAAIGVVLYMPFHAHFVPRDRMGVGVVTQQWIDPAIFARTFGISLFLVGAGVLFLYLRCRSVVGTLAALVGLVLVLAYAWYLPGNLLRVAGLAARTPLLSPDAQRDAANAGILPLEDGQVLWAAQRANLLPDELVPRGGRGVAGLELTDEVIDRINERAGRQVLTRPVTWQRALPPWFLVLGAGLLVWLAAYAVLRFAARSGGTETPSLALSAAGCLWAVALLATAVFWFFLAGLPILRDLGSVGELVLVKGGLNAPEPLQPYALAAVLAVPIALIALTLLRRRLPAPAVGPLVLAFIGLSVAAGIEVFMIREGIWGSTRWNTIFKFHLQVWIYLALAGSALLATVMQWKPERPTTPAGRLGRWAVKLPLGLAAALLVLMAAAFALGGPLAVTVAPGAAGRCARGERPTLDGLAYLRERDMYAYDLITCLNRNVAGAPVLAEAPCDSYHHDESRMGWNTGLPTIVTWEHHVKERNHTPQEVNERARDVRTLYTKDPEDIRGVAAKYNVDYIALGPYELSAMGVNAAERLDRCGDFLSLLRRVRIRGQEQSLYRVQHDKNRFYLVSSAAAGPAGPASYITPESGVSMFQGGKGFANGQFDEIWGLALGPRGDVYVVDCRNHRFQVFSATGEFRYALGELGNGLRQFKEPNDIDVAPDGRIFVADTWNNRVQVLSATGQVVGDLRPERAPFFGPRSVCLLKSGLVAVADAGHHRVVVLDAQGNLKFAVGRRDQSPGSAPGELKEPRGVAALPDGGLVVCDSENARLQLFTERGQWLRTIPVDYGSYSGGANDTFVAVGPDGTLYVTDGSGGRVLAYDLEGNLKGMTTRGMQGPLQRPRGIDVDPAGRLLYVTDHGTNRVLSVRLPLAE